MAENRLAPREGHTVVNRVVPGAAGSASSTPSNRSVGITLAAALLLVLSIALVYAPVRHAQFVRIDDPHYVSQNAFVAAGLAPETLAWAWTTFHAANWHPLTWWSHASDVEWFGLDPGAHHLANVAWHAANALLVWLVLARFTGARARAFVVAALFALHPLHVESVAWVSERKDLLSTFFALLALLAYAWHARAPSFARMSVVAAFLAASLLAKPMHVTLPFLLLVLDAWPLGRGTSWALVREKWLLFVLVTASAVVTVAAQSHGGAVASIEQWTFGDRLLEAVRAYAGYLRLAVWPSALGVHVPHGALGGALAAVLSALVLCGVSFVAWRERVRRPYVLCGWLWFLGTLVPVIGLVQVGLQAMADRYSYWPLLGPFAAVTWWIADLLQGRSGRAMPVDPERPASGALRTVTSPALAVALTCAVLVPLSVRARAQVATWHDSLTLFTHAVATHPTSAVARQSLGDELVARGRVEEGLRELRRAIELAPGYEVAHNGLGIALSRAGDRAAGIAALRRATELAPDFFEAHYNLGIELYESGDVIGAQRSFARAVESRAWHYEARANLAATSYEIGRTEEARVHLREAARLAPRLPDDQRRVAAIAEALGEWATARTAWRRVVELGGGDPEVQERLVELESAIQGAAPVGSGSK